MRYAARVDDNQASIVEEIRKIGGVVTYLFAVGGGVSDLLVSFRAAWYVFEVKNPKAKPSDRQLSPDEKEWILAQRAPVHVVMSGEQAVEILLACK